MLSVRLRAVFDAVLDEEVAVLPAGVAAMLEEVPLVVEDEPSRRLLDEMGIGPGEGDLCGLHQGVPLTERSVEESGRLPDRMMLFRGPIIRLAGYSLLHGTAGPSYDELVRQVHITLLHEIGHHYGLDEDDLDALGYA
ncbi:MAG: metallopeptidase family protein [Planctomycetota bacterium]